ncbi:sigma-54-dependent Fis family transcriptional regulator, partial [candidate division KSB1 bacterium]|nr:sigma-54-dependent Fis family transcriptional regulator [candidate division KSB1 bacterium]
MTANHFDQILKELKVAFAIFDADLMLVEQSQNFTQITQTVGDFTNRAIWDIFPELFGSEEPVQAVLQRKARRYQLEKMNKFTENGELGYYTLTLLPVKDKVAQLLCLVIDTTIQTSLEQSIYQQKYEIELLKAQLVVNNQVMSGGILGESEQIKAVRNFINKIATIKSTSILLQGESGVGKNLVARAIHQSSMSLNAPFVEINCASIPATLIESEIFGYEKGAFTNALQMKRGLIEEADGGTLFLDEIGELPLSLQAKFLSFLESKNFRRLGSTQERSVDLRVIAATNKDLAQAVDRQEFRQDLYYRINVVAIALPPLRVLGDDILMLAQHFITLFAFNFRKKVNGLTAPAKAKLLNYAWPGNVRELRNLIERAVIFAEGEQIDAADLLLSPEGKRPTDSQSLQLPENGVSLFEVEKQLLQDALHKTKGNQSKAARLLGLTLDTFRYRMKKYAIT